MPSFKPEYTRLPYYTSRDVVPQDPPIPEAPREPFARLCPYVQYIRRPDTGAIVINKSRRLATYLRELEQDADDQTSQ